MRINEKTINTIIEKQETQLNKYILDTKDNNFTFNQTFANCIKDTTIKLDNLDLNNNFHEFAYNGYNGVNFINTKIGKLAALSVDHYLKVEGKSFWCCEFTNCEFKNIIFNGCHISACKFNNCHFDNVLIFHSSMRFSDLNSPKNIQTQFKNCMFTNLRIENESLCNNICFNSCCFILSSIRNTEMPNSIFYKCRCHGLTITNSDINDSIFYEPINYNLDFRISFSEIDIDNITILISRGNIKSNIKSDRAKTKSAIKEIVKSKDKDVIKKIHSKIVEHKSIVNDYYTDLTRLYYSLSKSLYNCSDNTSLINQLFYYRNYFKMKKERKLVDIISYTLFGFGHQIWKFVLWLFGIIVSFSIAYLYNGIKLITEDITIDYSFTGSFIGWKQLFNDMIYSLHFSIATFSTVGFGNIVPIGYSYIISIIQMALGIVLFAILTAMLINKFIKSH